MKREENGKSRDPFLCTCGPCKRFWRSTFGPEAGQLKRSPACWSKSVTSLSTNKSPYLPIGGRVVVKDKHPGTVQYVGYLDTPSDAPKLYVGVKLDDNVNSAHNGIYQGKRYFYCPKGHGAFVRPNNLRPASAPNKKPALTGNFMFPSYEVVKQRRKERELQLASLDSSSSCSGSVVESRSFPSLDRRRPQPILKVTSDPNDMVHLDRQRNMEREKRRLQMSSMEIQNRQRKKEPTQLQKWKAEFGGDERAARMAETLQKLHLAYEEGRKLVEGEATCD